VRGGLYLLGGIGIGAGLMYLLDPRLGRTRRAYLRDQAVGLWHDAQEEADKLRRDAANRARGVAAEARSWFAREAVPDRVLTERVRSHLGRVVSHPGALEVSATGGRVTLSGPILAHEVERVLGCVRAVPGVREVDNRLEAHESAGRLPSLQGGEERPGPAWELFQRNWSPTTRFLVASGGLGLLGYGLTLKAPWACVVGGLGLGVMAGGLAHNVNVGEWVGWEGASRPEGGTPPASRREGEMRQGERPPYAAAYV
jgi:hypothetical protein